MDIRYKFVRVRGRRKWIAEVWNPEPDPLLNLSEFDEPYPEEVYVEINEWCEKTFGYHARTAFHIFEFRNKKHLDWFLLRWL